MAVVSFGVRDAATLRREGGNVAVRPGKWGYRLERLASPIAFGVREDRDACGRVIANLGLRWDSLADRCNGELVSWTIVERETVTLYGTLSVTAGRVLLRLRTHRSNICYITSRGYVLCSLHGLSAKVRYGRHMVYRYNAEIALERRAAMCIATTVLFWIG